MSGMFEGDPGPREETPPPGRSGRSRTLVITAAVLVVLFLGLTGFSSFWTERLWFKSVGFGSVFQTLLWTRIGLFLVFGGVMAAVVALNLALAYRARPLLLNSGDANLARYRDADHPGDGLAVRRRLGPDGHLRRRLRRRSVARVLAVAPLVAVRPDRPLLQPRRRLLRLRAALVALPHRLRDGASR